MVLLDLIGVLLCGEYEGELDQCGKLSSALHAVEKAVE